MEVARFMLWDLDSTQHYILDFGVIADSPTNSLRNAPATLSVYINHTAQPTIPLFALKKAQYPKLLASSSYYGGQIFTFHFPTDHPPTSQFLKKRTLHSSALSNSLELDSTARLRGIMQNAL